MKRCGVYSKHDEESPGLLRLHLQFCSVSRNDSFLKKLSNPSIPPFRKGGLRGDLKNWELGFMQMKVAAKARGREGVETKI